ncbi:MAG: hypothetical protein WCS27_14005, partial [Victivallaceae bacterium]
FNHLHLRLHLKACRSKRLPSRSDKAARSYFRSEAMYLLWVRFISFNLLIGNIPLLLKVLFESCLTCNIPLKIRFSPGLL